MQFSSAGLGVGVEWWGRAASAQASRQAAEDLAHTIDDAVEIADSAMDRCTGQITLDTFGFSRGTTVTSEALRLVTTDRLQYNADVSLTVIDAIDPSWGPPYRNNSCWGTLLPNGDSIRPWAKAGYVVGDPIVSPAGSAMVSSVYTGRPDEVFPPLAPLVSVTEGLMEFTPVCSGPFDFRRDVVGLPSGYDRRSSLTVEAGGRFASAVSLSHNEARDNLFGRWVWIDGSPILQTTAPLTLTNQPDGYTSLSPNSAPFSFVDVTHMGKFVITPTLNPDLPGWLLNQPIDQPIDPDDSDRLPPECPGATGSGPTENPRQAVSAYSNVRDDEFVTDPEFDFSEGMVANATELIEIDSLLPDENKNYRLVNLFPLTSTLILDFIRDTATAGFPTSRDQRGGWIFVDPPASCVEQGIGNCIKLRSFSPASRTEQFAARFASLIPPGADLSDEDTLNRLQEFQEQWEAATLDGDQLSADRVNLYQQILSGGSRLDEAYVHFPRRKATLRQTLEFGSRSHSRLIVRVFYAMLGNNGKLEVRLNGQNLDVTESVDSNGEGFRRELMFVAERDGEPNFGVADTLELSGQDVWVFAVSVRAEMPQRNRINGHYYDYVVFDGGTDWEAAQAIAKRWTFQGRNGRLATFSGADEDAFLELRRMFKPDTFVWLGAKRTPKDLKERFDSYPWHPSVTFEPHTKEDSYLFAYPDGSFGHAPMSVTKQGRPFGFFIDYGPE